MKASLGGREKGAVAIEFALVFVMFFTVFYGLLSYSLPMLMVQSFNQASSEAVRRCVALDPTSATYGTDVTNLAKQVLEQQLAWLPGALRFQYASDATVTLTSGKLLTVSVHYDKAKITSAMPVLVLPVIGEVPRLPARLGAQASLQL
ncbi:MULTISPECIES: TadE/TadG family type IV pilus assembly protein [unclassified Pseudomonas]|uniref:TadE/TadG family type IV pilus assembly protein n=1 Tax=unclassified Pseudomonas TaxID=196821 RepID=UPI000BA3DBC7|nr:MULTISPECIES: TadE/TadG family type IV pilus assembly protein [unclassified Pseudomonas]MCU1723987.1 pilus assembly protein [Pseudomonas sp. 5P_5.1_Bac1]MCU1730540.1 pilus assembly protein [Pseudomonas sp. 20P_3.2_Bac4]MCU1746435.1 pilus assembly protein [Pseudomonas sp. 20P_3.2_Bac5]